MDAGHARRWLSARIERIRAVGWTTLLAGSTIVAVVVVLTALHFRREGSRTAEDAFVGSASPSRARCTPCSMRRAIARPRESSC